MAEKVLLIDDEKHFVEILSERMRSRGMEVTTATSAKQGLQKADTEYYDAIILDLMMPEMNGIEALVALREKNPDLQIILLTGYATMDVSIEAMKLGATDFLEKPIDIKTLTEKIKEAHAKKTILVEKRNREKIRQAVLGKSDK
jgi:DNA-binding NtrC family response regulator